MTSETMKRGLHEGRRVYGTLVTSPSPDVPAQLKSVGVDFAFIDTEHITLDRSQFSWMCQTFKALGIVPIVRITAPDPYQATVALDGGASGVVAPYVETPEQVRALRGAVKRRPLKGQRLDRALADSGSLEPALSTYLDEHNREHLLIINVESRPAIENLDDILAIPEIDALLVGPHDLSCNLGIPEQYHAPEFEEAVGTILRKARGAGVGAGVHFWAGMDQQVDWAQKYGLNMIVHKGDVLLFLEGLSSDLSEIRRELGEDATVSTSSYNV